MKRLFVILSFVAFSLPLVAQPGRVYRSLQDVKNPDDVFILSLKRKHLKSIPPEVFTFVNLEVLDLSHNRIDTIPPDIARLRNLQTLNLSCNNIRFLPIEIGLLPRLAELDMNRNPLMELPESLGFSSSLQTLVLWSTAIYRIPDTFANLDTVLHVIDLRSCQLSITDQEEISSLLPSVKKKWDQSCNCR